MKKLHIPASLQLAVNAVGSALSTTLNTLSNTLAGIICILLLFVPLLGTFAVEVLLSEFTDASKTFIKNAAKIHLAVSWCLIFYFFYRVATL